MMFTSKNSQAATCRTVFQGKTRCLERHKIYPFLYSNPPIWDCAFFHGFKLESHLTPQKRSATGCAIATDLNHYASIFWPTSEACLCITGTVAWLSEHTYSKTYGMQCTSQQYWASKCPLHNLSGQPLPRLDQFKKMFSTILHVYQKSDLDTCRFKNATH